MFNKKQKKKAFSSFDQKYFLIARRGIQYSIAWNVYMFTIFGSGEFTSGLGKKLLPLLPKLKERWQKRNDNEKMKAFIL